MGSNIEKKRAANKSVMEVLRRIDRGQLLNDIDKALVAIAAGIEENNGGKGDITIKIKVGAKAKSDALEISGDVAFKVPARKRTSAIMFFDPDAGEDSEGALGPLDPRQPDLPEVVKADELNRRRMGERDD